MIVTLAEVEVKIPVAEKNPLKKIWRAIKAELSG